MLTPTGHEVGATYENAYWGGTYKVVRAEGYGVVVECVTPGGGAHQIPGEQWWHCTSLSKKDERVA